jgi:hypothetical protein
MIKSPTQVTEIVYSDDKQTRSISIDGGEITIKIISS